VNLFKELRLAAPIIVSKYLQAHYLFLLEAIRTSNLDSLPFQTHLKFVHNPFKHKSTSLLLSSFQKKELVIFKRTFLKVCTSICFLTLF
jgi:hypothetical protein